MNVLERLLEEYSPDLVPLTPFLVVPMASGGVDAKTEILVDVETSPKVAVVNGEPAAASIVKSDYAAIPEGGGGGMYWTTISDIAMVRSWLTHS